MEWTIAIGVDTHRDRHVAVAVDRLGRRLDSLEIAVDHHGFQGLIRFSCLFGEPAFAIEGTGSYGASLARVLLGEGFAVFEVERPKREHRNEKNDLIDAELAARRLLTGERLPLPWTGIEREQLRSPLVERRSAQHARQQAVNQRRRRSSRSICDCGAGSRRASPDRLPQCAFATPAVRAASPTGNADPPARARTRRRRPRTPGTHPHTLPPRPTSPVSAPSAPPRSLFANPDRIRSEPAFAVLAGVSPIEASSGPNKRHRLNRSGYCLLNWTSITALNRIRYHPENLRGLPTTTRTRQNPTGRNPHHQTLPRPPPLPHAYRERRHP